MEEQGVCPWVQDRLDALAVAAKLGIPLITLDFEQQYKEDVFKYFVQEYKAGRTPNPDILCNEIIKFGAFLEYALAHGADYIATGHHVRRVPVQGNDKDETVRLLAGVDTKKDQSYFLSRLNQHQLKHSLFPIGTLTKDQVREIATKEGLDVVAQKRSTRGICFIGKVDLKNFLSQYTIEKEGDIVDVNGNKIGKHKGVAFYTVGQRKGLEIAAASPDAKPYYVVAKDAKTNQLTVASVESGALNADELYCKELHWLDGKIRSLPLVCQARIRYHQPLQEITLSFGSKDGLDPDVCYVKFKEPQRSITPGQFIVFYEGETLLGSAVID
jgi:tRNA-specific 2-thiouridylase